MKLTFKPCLIEQDFSNFIDILDDIKRNEKLYYSCGLTCRIYRNSITCYGRESINLMITILQLRGVRFYV